MNYLFSRCDDKKTGSLDQFPVRCGHIYTEPGPEPNLQPVRASYYLQERESAGAHNSHNSLCLKTRGYIIRIIDKGKAKGVKSALESEWIQFLFLNIKIK